MAWNIDKCLYAQVGTASTSANRLISAAGKQLWAVVPLGQTHQLVSFDIVGWHSSMAPADERLVDPQSRAYSPDISVSDVGNVSQLTAYGDFVYVGSSEFSTQASNFTKIKVYSTAGKLVEIVTPPVMMNSNIVVDNSKLWMVSYSTNAAAQQTLYWYDLNAKVWSSAGIPVRHQDKARFLARDHSGHILICDYNNLSVSRFSNNGVFQNTTRIAPSGGGANREPSFIAIDDLRNVYVSSFQGMISKLDTVANTATPYSTGMGDVHGFVDDGVNQWIATEKRASSVSWQGRNLTCYYSHVARGTAPDVEMWQDGGDGAAGTWTPGTYYVDAQEDVLRIKKTSQEIRHFSTMERDLLINPTAGGSVAGRKVNNILLTPSMTITTVGGNITVPSYVWMIFSDNGIQGWPATGSMFRENYYEMKGLAMMSVGQYDYVGE